METEVRLLGLGLGEQGEQEQQGESSSSRASWASGLSIQVADPSCCRSCRGDPVASRLGLQLLLPTMCELCPVKCHLQESPGPLA